MQTIANTINESKKKAEKKCVFTVRLTSPRVTLRPPHPQAS